jgi:hypothetical protein
MKLNPDCMRDILLVMEDAGYLEELSPSTVYEALPDYAEDEINYSIIKLKEAGFIDAIIREYNNGLAILRLDDITYTGHQFLADVRSDNVWNDIKEVSKKVGSNSISAISQIATGVISAIIKNQLGLQ